MDLSDEVKENVELVEDKTILSYLKSALRYCNKYERYELESDYTKAYNYVEKAINFSDSKTKEQLLVIKELVASKKINDATNKLNFLIKRQNADIIEFPDKDLESLIRETINMPEGNILSTDLEEITYLDASQKNISCLKGISCLINLRYLDLSFNSLHDQEAAKHLRDIGNFGVTDTFKMSFAVPFLKPEFSELSQLSKLQTLNLSGNVIKEISFLKGLGNLTELDLGYCYFIEDIAPLSSLSNLEKLNLTHNMIENIEVLQNMQKLRNLDLSNNKLKNINPLRRLLSLEDVDLSNFDESHNKVISFNSINDIQFLIDLPNLRYLDIENNPVKKIKDLSKSKSLESVRFNGKNIENLNELGGYYFDFRRFHTKPLGCLVSLSIFILLIRYTIKIATDGYPLGGLPIFALGFPSAVLTLWEAYRLDDEYNKVRGFIILAISFLFLIFGNGNF